ncbi:pH-signaling protein PalC [Aspergillus clavatus NRRL 1]|uniref:pH-response regulator protein palC n=1 Tax=Aspergillus clavatus (strain ATCC 1007 / CBS 513.65 / DSM 816 / NCTC 3887 / NRRL 1 / QM 1276 / 107) TaxID=344612 RepID=A1C755_ASPCL|nr:pH-signaling protein PalC [Aspergillus clavatus NRRL 1]EAW14226.1 pH-signalling protein PalC [Aspergillus clavatus NRRL 1]
MVYASDLPTTSHLSFQTFLSSSTHPSLPQAASTARHALRLALKNHKRLPRSPQRDAHLTTVIGAINDYLPYIVAISYGLSGRPLGSINPSTGSSTGSGEEIEITLRSEIESEWRATLSLTPLSLKSRSKNGRVRGQGIDFEIAFVLTTLGYVLSSVARSGVLRTLYAATTPTTEQRTAAVQNATKYLLQASSVHALLTSSPSFAGAGRLPGSAAIVPDLDPATQAALSSLALAEATLIAVLKDDSYVAACIQARNPNDKDWMVRAPEIPKVRALLFARLCVRAAEYAEQAAAGLGSVGAQGKTGIDEDVVKYARALGRVARARACRFFGVDAELAGKIGEGIAWLRAAKGALGLRPSPQGERETLSKSKGGFSRLKKEWAERREDRKMEKDVGSRDRVAKGELHPGDDAGRDEEGRVIDMLETKWVRMNDTINTQLIPPSTDLLTNLPSGRDIHSPPGPYRLPWLDEDELARMRAPPAEEDFEPSSDVEDSDDEPTGIAEDAPGAVPERSESSYY